MIMKRSFRSVGENEKYCKKLKEVNIKTYNVLNILFLICLIASIVKIFSMNSWWWLIPLLVSLYLSLEAIVILDNNKREILYPSSVFTLIKLHNTIIKEEDGIVVIPAKRWIRVKGSYKYISDGGNNWKIELVDEIQQIRVEKEILFQSEAEVIVSKHKFKKTKIGKTIA